MKFDKVQVVNETLPDDQATGTVVYETSTASHYIYSTAGWVAIDNANKLLSRFNIYDPDTMIEYIDQLNEI